MAAKRRRTRQAATRAVPKKSATRKKAASKKTAKKKARRAKPPAPARSPSAPSDPSTCELRTPSGETCRLPFGPVMREAAMRWSYKVRNRGRWAGNARALRELRSDAFDELARMRAVVHEPARAALDTARADLQAFLEQAAKAGMIEVSVPYTIETDGWEGRVLPWEFLLSAASHSVRSGRTLIVTRHLDDRSGLRFVPPVAWRAMFVESAPGAFAREFTFVDERRILKRNLSVQDDGDAPDGADALIVVRNPTIRELQDRCRDEEPAIVHLSGVDAHQGGAILGLDRRRVEQDGFYLRDDEEAQRAATASELATAVTAGAPAPALVFINAFNSAARLAALTVAEGAGAAVGFQAEFDDALAELFVETFYRALWLEAHGKALDAGSLVRAFRLAWEPLRGQPSIDGSGIVLWSRQSVLGDQEIDEGVSQAMAEEMRRDLAPPPGPDRRAALEDVLSISVVPCPHINYALLHNDQDIFKQFELRPTKRGRLRDVAVHVALRVGDHEFPFQASFDLPHPSSEPGVPGPRGGTLGEVRGHDYAGRIRVPLTWDYIRSLTESVRTSLHVRITQRETLLYEDSHLVTLDPTEEWIDNRRSGPWLPSFVLPRDPAVAEIIDRAQKYLRSLMDYVGAGFDGYQSVDPDAEDPSECVDLQVRAIWSALVYELDIAYVNPPPSYVKSWRAAAQPAPTPADSEDRALLGPAQRIRKPSTVVNGHRGTCIDLAILFASCLEFVEIYPVLFLLKGHCFAGYWRSEEAYERFRTATGGRSTDVVQGGDGGVPQRKWMVDVSSYREILQLVNQDELVPIETVAITSGTSFQEAFEQGIENLEDEDEFDALVDVLIARENTVTPLPL